MNYANYTTDLGPAFEKMDYLKALNEEWAGTSAMGLKVNNENEGLENLSVKRGLNFNTNPNDIQVPKNQVS